MYKEIDLSKILYYKRKHKYELFYEKYGEPLYLQLGKGYLSKKITDITKYVWLGYFSNCNEKTSTFNYLNKLKNTIEDNCNIKIDTFFYDNGICIPCQNYKGNLQIEIYIRQNEKLWEGNLNEFPEKSYITPIIFIENVYLLDNRWRINIKLVQICVYPLYQKFGKCVIDINNNEIIEKNIIIQNKDIKLDNDITLGNFRNIKISEHPIYNKYFKMRKMGIPLPAIIHKMNNEVDNIDAQYILNIDPDEIIKLEFIMIEEHSNYNCFFKMLKIGIPKAAVQQKMLLEGLDIDYIDKGKELIPNIVFHKNKDIFSELFRKKLKKRNIIDNNLLINSIENKEFSKLDNILEKNNKKTLNKMNSVMGISMEELLKKRNTIFQNSNLLI